MPDIESGIHQPYQDHGVRVFGLHPGEDPDLLEDFVDQTGITFPLHHSQGTRGLFRFPYGTGYPYPRDVIVGKDLTVRSVKNSFEVSEAEELVLELLAE